MQSNSSVVSLPNHAVPKVRVLDSGQLQTDAQVEAML